jgi:hypothetical protein
MIVSRHFDLDAANRCSMFMREYLLSLTGGKKASIPTAADTAAGLSLNLSPTFILLLFNLIIGVGHTCTLNPIK